MGDMKAGPSLANGRRQTESGHRQSENVDRSHLIKVMRAAIENGIDINPANRMERRLWNKIKKEASC